MKIENLQRITGGVLLNTPPIDAIARIKISAQKIEARDLFIDVNHSSQDIAQALINGAYCIISEKIDAISDPEVAWIRVDCVKSACIKLARFYATQKKHTFIRLSVLQFELSEFLVLKTKIKKLSNDPCASLTQIIHAPDETIFFAVALEFIDKIDPSVQKMQTPSFSLTARTQKSLFYCSFIFQDRFVDYLRLSSLFLNDFCILLGQIQALCISYDIEKQSNFKHFYPFFVDERLTPREFGTSQKVVIFESEQALFQKEIDFLQSSVNSEELIISVPEQSAQIFTCKAKKLVYNGDWQIEILQNSSFRYALVLCNCDDIEAYFVKQNRQQTTLF